MRSSPFGIMIAVVAGLLLVIGLFCIAAGVYGMRAVHTSPTNAEIQAKAGRYVDPAIDAAESTTVVAQTQEQTTQSASAIGIGFVLCLPAVGVFLFRNKPVK